MLSCNHSSPVHHMHSSPFNSQERKEEKRYGQGQKKEEKRIRYSLPSFKAHPIPFKGQAWWPHAEAHLTGFFKLRPTEYLTSKRRETTINKVKYCPKARHELYTQA